MLINSKCNATSNRREGCEEGGGDCYCQSDDWKIIVAESHIDVAYSPYKRLCADSCASMKLSTGQFMSLRLLFCKF